MYQIQIYSYPRAFVRVVRPFKPQISFGQAESSRVVPCVGARAHVAVPKMLSRDRPCAFFVRSCTHGNPKFRSGDLGRLAQGGSSHVVPCVGAPAHVYHSESLKLFPYKCFGEDVCNFLISGTMAEMDCFGLNMMLNQMIFSIDVLRSIMELWFLCQLYCRSIVNHEWS